MGAHAYWYTVPYESDINAALQKLRQREFLAGRYNPVIRILDFPLSPASPAPGNKHGSIEEALNASDADGTRSILDISSISDEPEMCSACPLDESVLEDLYGTPQPTREVVEANMDFLEDIDRGQAVYITLYKNGVPDEIFFAGYSFD